MSELTVVGMKALMWELSKVGETSYGQVRLTSSSS